MPLIGIQLHSITILSIRILSHPFQTPGQAHQLQLMHCHYSQQMGEDRFAEEVIVEPFMLRHHPSVLTVFLVVSYLVLLLTCVFNYICSSPVVEIDEICNPIHQSSTDAIIPMWRALHSAVEGQTQRPQCKGVFVAISWSCIMATSSL